MGDLYVKVSLEVPTKLTAKQKKAIEEMGKVVDHKCYQKKVRLCRKNERTVQIAELDQISRTMEDGLRRGK